MHGHYKRNALCSRLTDSERRFIKVGYYYSCLACCKPTALTIQATLRHGLPLTDRLSRSTKIDELHECALQMKDTPRFLPV